MLCAQWGAFSIAHWQGFPPHCVPAPALGTSLALQRYRGGLQKKQLGGEVLSTLPKASHRERGGGKSNLSDTSGFLPCCLLLSHKPRARDKPWGRHGSGFGPWISAIHLHGLTPIDAGLGGESSPHHHWRALMESAFG